MIKDLKKDIEGLEVKIKEEQSQKKRVTNSVSQKENKITVLSNKLNEITTLNKEQEKKIKEYEKKIEEYESSGKVVKAQPKPAKNQKKSGGPRLFGANDEGKSALSLKFKFICYLPISRYTACTTTTSKKS